jgi:hypothetical protein
MAQFSTAADALFEDFPLACFQICTALTDFDGQQEGVR